MLNLKMRKKYYYVQRCPECKSRVTGQYLKRPKYEVDANYMIRESLKHGELITLVDEIPRNNCYCEDCGHEWRYRVEGLLISPERYHEEGEVRGARKRLIEFDKEHPRRKGFFKTALGFLPHY